MIRSNILINLALILIENIKRVAQIDTKIYKQIRFFKNNEYKDPVPN